tara:strand:- start:449 stop:988 length:540 start_codon:yes stop_codon:yes gene_type:complete
MTLWVNPFLDVFYDWGLERHWESKESFLVFLDTTPYPIYEVEKYIKENVPEWYWEVGMSMKINGGGLDYFLECWEGDMQYLTLDGDGNESFSVGNNATQWHETNKPAYNNYPEYLKINDEMMRLFNSKNQGNYVKLVKLKGNWKNSLLFTTKQGESWCNMSSGIKYLNWINRNPMEVKE